MPDLVTNVITLELAGYHGSVDRCVRAALAVKVAVRDALDEALADQRAHYNDIAQQLEDEGKLSSVMTQRAIGASDLHARITKRLAEQDS